MTMDTNLVSAAQYHRRTKHQLARFAAGPETLDWDAQPSPFRTWAGAPLIHLPLVADHLATTWAELDSVDGVSPHELDLRALACLLELSFGLTAWKQFGPDRWALRANPSSGNLHPTEAYVLARGVQGLADGLYHYEPLQHALVCRALYEAAGDAEQGCGHGLWIGLSAIQWREAWKYGERAFRYCELDAGHALGAVRYAAAALGWQARRLDGLCHAELSVCMGLDRDADFGVAEREEAAMLIAVGPALALGASPLFKRTGWYGQASRLDPRPMYKWPVIDAVSECTRVMRAPDVPSPDSTVPPYSQPHLKDFGEQRPSARQNEPAASLIRGRRSAQHFDRQAQMPEACFTTIIRALLPAHQLPWDAWPWAPRVHGIFYVYRVDGVEPGVYVLPRSERGEAMLRHEIKAASTWVLARSLMRDDQGHDWPLWRVAEHPGLPGALRQLSCHQAIASDACWSMSMVAEFDGALGERADAYRLLLQEAGLMGQALYLNAEAQGFRGTGIGCYFDDAVHHLLSIDGERLQVLYHFTVGMPTVDSRIQTEPPYDHLSPSRLEGSP